MELIIRSGNETYVCEDWEEFLATWEEYGDSFVSVALRSDDFRRWLKVIAPGRYKIFQLICENDWSQLADRLYLAYSVIAIHEKDFTSRTDVMNFVKILEDLFGNIEGASERLVAFLQGAKVYFIRESGKEAEIEFWRSKDASEVEEQRQEVDNGHEETGTGGETEMILDASSEPAPKEHEPAEKVRVIIRYKFSLFSLGTQFRVFCKSKHEEFEGCSEEISTVSDFTTGLSSDDKELFKGSIDILIKDLKSEIYESKAGLHVVLTTLPYAKCVELVFASQNVPGLPSAKIVSVQGANWKVV